MQDTSSKESESELENSNIISIKPAESRWVVVDLRAPYGNLNAGSHKVEFEVKDVNSGQSVKEKSVFLVPRQ